MTRTLDSAEDVKLACQNACCQSPNASAMFASAQLRHPLVAPGAVYYLIIAAGIAASLGIIAATFPLLARITGPEVARNE